MSISPIPTRWQDLQKEVAQILYECGLSSETEKKITTVRGTVDVDVFAQDDSQKPTVVYLCECKLWKNSVPKREVHAFRTVVDDYGANWGLIISSKSFQSGAYEAAEYSNVRLLNWEEFQDLFIDRWIINFMMPQIYQKIDALVQYTEHINSRIIVKANTLPPNKQKMYKQLRERYMDLAFYALFISSPCRIEALGIQSSLRDNIFNLKDSYKNSNLHEDIHKTSLLRDLILVLCKHVRIATNEFDDVFGERA